MRFAVLFPGQGSQKVGMGLDLLEKTPLARELFNKVDNIIGRKLSEIFLYGPENELNQTKNTQPSIAIVSALLTLLLKDELKKKNLDFVPSACCGHSLGEFTALWFCELLSLEDLIKIVAVRGDLMQKAPSGSMAAVLNLTKEQIESLLDTNVKTKIVIANYNTPTQLVISGEKVAIEEIISRIKSLGGKAIILPVSGAFHSPLMDEPAREFIKEFDKLQISSGNIKIPVLQNTDGKASTDIIQIKEKIKRQMTSSVLWTHTVNNLSASGIDNVIEIGPGKILTGLVKKINPNINCYNIYDYTSLIDFVLSSSSLVGA